MDEMDEGGSFGVSQLDNITLGRIRPGSIGLLYGPSGTGKSSLLFHFLFQGASVDSNVCLITTEPPTTVSSRMAGFKSHDAKWLRDGYISILNIFDMLSLIGVDISDMESGDDELLFDLIVETIDHLDAKRVVIDPINPILEALDKCGSMGFFQSMKGKLLDKEARLMLSFDTAKPMKEWEDNSLSTYDLDHVIRFKRESEAPLILNTMTIERWRSATHSNTSYVVDISQDGVVLVPRIKPLEVR